MNLKFTRILVAILLLLALLKLPIGYYTFLKIFIVIISLILVYKANDLKNQVWFILFLILAIIFNPIIPIYFNKLIWKIIDIFAAIIFLMSLYYLKFERIISEEKYQAAKKRIDERKNK